MELATEFQSGSSATDASRCCSADARKNGRNVLLFLDQFEELYTLVPEAEDRLAFTACIGSITDDTYNEPSQHFQQELYRCYHAAPETWLLFLSFSNPDLRLARTAWSVPVVLDRAARDLGY